MAPEVIGRPKCGFCMTGNHENCKKEITYYEKTWVCECPHNQEKKEQDINLSGD
jgi:hypothetical protein